MDFMDNKIAPKRPIHIRFYYKCHFTYFYSVFEYRVYSHTKITNFQNFQFKLKDVLFNPFYWLYTLFT
jgi:hypothetical protein